MPSSWAYAVADLIWARCVPTISNSVRLLFILGSDKKWASLAVKEEEGSLHYFCTSKPSFANGWVQKQSFILSYLTAAFFKKRYSLSVTERQLTDRFNMNNASSCPISISTCCLLLHDHAVISFLFTSSTYAILCFRTAIRVAPLS